MNATVPERAPEGFERTTANADMLEGEGIAPADASWVDEPAPGEADSRQSAPVEPAETDAAERQDVPGEPAGADAPAEAAADDASECQDVPAKPDGVDEPAPAESSAADEPSMAWHRFLTGFWLWLAALYHAFQAGWMLLGGQYYSAEIREIAYAGLPMLRMLDWALAGVAAVAAVLCILSAAMLRKKRSAGPVLLCWTYILLLAGQLGFAAGRFFLIGLTPLSASTLGPLAVYLALLLVNGSYYRRRRSCFAPRG